VRREEFDVIFMFSNEWQPEHDLFREWPFLNTIRREIFHRRPQLSPAEVRQKYDLYSRVRFTCMDNG